MPNNNKAHSIEKISWRLFYCLSQFSAEKAIERKEASEMYWSHRYNDGIDINIIWFELLVLHVNIFTGDACIKNKKLDKQ